MFKYYALIFMKKCLSNGLGRPSKKYCKKVWKTWNCLASLAISEVLTIHPTNFFRPHFNSQFFLSNTFYFGHKTPRAKTAHSCSRVIGPRFWVVAPWSQNIRKLGLDFLSPHYNNQFSVSFHYCFQSEA